MMADASANGLDGLNGYNGRALWAHLQLPDLDFFQFLNSCGLVYAPGRRPCVKCDGNMTFRERMRGERPFYAFRCSSAKCGRTECGYFDDTFFSNAHLTSKEVWQFGYYFARNTHTYEEYELEFRRPDGSTISARTIADWKNFFRDVTCEYFLQHPVKIGGPGKVVEIDETILSRRKYHCGRVLPGRWIFGGIERDSEGRKCFMVECPCADDCPNPRGQGCCQGKRDAATLLPLLDEYVLPGTLIMSDGWAAYGGIAAMVQEYGHLTVNHSEHFVDPGTGAHTQGVEGNWSLFKKKFVKQPNGLRRDLLKEYISEYLWRRQFGGADVVRHLWGQVAQLYPLQC